MKYLIPLLAFLIFSIIAKAESSSEFDQSAIGKESEAFDIKTNQPGNREKLFESFRKHFPTATNLPTQEETKLAYKNAKPISKGSVIYPRELRKAGVEGQVLVAMLVDEEGDVINVSVVQSTNELLNDAAARSVWTWKFIPAFVGDSPRKSVVIAPFKFALDHGNNDRSANIKPKRAEESGLPNLDFVH